MADPSITTLGLCAGIGMLDFGVGLGLDCLGYQHRAVGYVERDAYAASILLARMEDAALEPAPVWAGNLQDVRWGRWAGCVDGVVAGFPCQPHSVAGRRSGADDERWTWPHIVNCLRLVRPSFAFLENVPGLRSSGGLDAVLTDLAALGFDAEWCSLRASDAGASHERERVFILAHTHRLRQQQPSGHQQGRRRRLGHCGAPMAHSRRPRLPFAELPGKPAAAEYRDGEGAAVTQFCRAPVFAPGPDSPEWRDISCRLPHLTPATESGLRMLADGLAVVVDESRGDQLRCVGNGVVPLQAATAFIELFQRVGLGR